MSENVAAASRKSLKVSVESIEIPVEKDGSILLSTLQSAFPGAHGLYYFDGSCKHANKYDGKDAKIFAPEDGWNDRAYFASLAHGRQAWQPYGSYENASKQFERSVTAVQRMLGGFDPSLVAVRQDERLTLKQPVATQQKAAPLPQPDIDVKNLLGALTLPQKYTKLTQSEQQIVDLAKLVSAKDSIIEQQRTELKTAESTVATSIIKQQENEREIVQLNARIDAQNHELEILRELAKEQTYLCSQIQSLTKENYSLNEKIVDKDKQIEQANGMLDELQSDVHELAVFSNTNLEAALHVNKEEKTSLENQINSLRGQLELSAHRLSELEPLTEVIGVSSGHDVKSYVQLQHDLESSHSQLDAITEGKVMLEKDISEAQSKIEELNQLSATLATENYALSQRSKELEAKCASIEHQLTNVDQSWTAKIGERTEFLTSDKQALEEEVSELRNRQSELTALTDKLATEALNASEKAEQAVAEKEELKKQLEAVEKVWQEKVTSEKNYWVQETDYLRSDLTESQRRVAELTALTDRFAADAHNHERLVIDML